MRLSASLELTDNSVCHTFGTAFEIEMWRIDYAR